MIVLICFQSNTKNILFVSYLGRGWAKLNEISIRRLSPTEQYYIYFSIYLLFHWPNAVWCFKPLLPLFPPPCLSVWRVWPLSGRQIASKHWAMLTAYFKMEASVSQNPKLNGWTHFTWYNCGSGRLGVVSVGMKKKIQGSKLIKIL